MDNRYVGHANGVDILNQLQADIHTLHHPMYLIHLEDLFESIQIHQLEEITPLHHRKDYSYLNSSDM